MANLTEESALRAAWPGVAAVVGIILLGMGISLTAVAKPGSALTPEMVREYNSSGTALEEEMSKKRRQEKRNEIPANAEEAHAVDTALDRFADAKGEMEKAKDSRVASVFWLKVVGALIAMVGAGGLLMRQQ